MANAFWIKTWKVMGSSNNTYNVGLSKDGNYGCSCPAWKFRRQECRHIRDIKRMVAEQMVVQKKFGKGVKFSRTIAVGA